MNKSWSKWIAAAVFLGHSATSVANESGVPVSNQTGYPTPALSQALAKWLPAELQEQLKARKLAIYASTVSFDTMRLCFAKVGITELAGPARNVRHPGYFQFTAKAMDEASWKASTCEAEAFGTALGTMMKQPMDVLFEDSELVRNAGGKRLAEKQDPKTVRIHEIGGIGSDIDPMFEMLHAHSIGKLFDYRAVQTFITSHTADLEDGRKVCMAQVGLSGRSNDGRNPRVPAYTSSYATILSPGNTRDCKVEVAKFALKHFLELAPEKMLADFSFVREDGRAQPVLSQVKAVAKRLATRAAPRQGAPVKAKQAGRDSVSCNNRCRNGDCLRTFSDGRQERWTAPRVFDPMTQNWKWDITTNACGI